jgi:hypothetical protein
MVGGFYAQFERMVKQISARGAFLDDSDSSRYNTNSKKNNLTKSKQFGSIIRVGRILESDVWPTAKAMCVPCFANKCRIRESDLQAACLYIIFLNGYKAIID